jgi:hypothetical protein
MSAIYLLTVFFTLSNLIIIFKIYFQKRLHFNRLLFASSPGLWMSSVAHPGLLLIYSFIYYFFLVVGAAGRKSTTKCTYQVSYQLVQAVKSSYGEGTQRAR